MSQELSALHQDWRARKQAVNRLAAGRDQERAATAEQLVQLIQHESLDLGVLNGALQTLVALGRPALDRLRPLLSHSLSEVRQAAAVVLGQLEPPLGVPMLRQMLNDPDTNVRYHAIEALGQQGARTAVPELVELARGADAFLAFAAVEALGAIGDPRALPELTLLLEEPILMGGAAGALARIGHPLALQPLLQCLSRQAEEEVVAALRRLLCEQPLRLEPAQRQLLEQHGALPELIPLEEACRSRDQAALARLLPEEPDRVLPLLEGESGLGAILAALPEAGPRVRRLLVQQGLRLGCPEAVLRGWLGCDSPGLRAASASWLMQAGLFQAEDLLGWWQMESEERARCEVLEGCSDELLLAAALRSGGPAEAALAVRRLAEIPARRGLPLLQSLPRPQDFWWSIYLCRTLGSWGVGSKWLAEFLTDARPPLRAEAARALARVDAQAALARLPALLEDAEPDVSEAALEALASLGQWDRVAEAGELQLLAASPRPQDQQRVLAELPDTFESLAAGPNAALLLGLDLSQQQWKQLAPSVSWSDPDPWVRREALLREPERLRPLALLDADQALRGFAERLS
ncbi:HEAT repeat domain-containing protein [bacterium]|nr:HEAT repeat domain-containing protein [bacterium]